MEGSIVQTSRKRKKNKVVHNESAKIYSKKSKIVIYTILSIHAIVILLPLFWLLMTALKTQADLTTNVWGLPRVYKFDNFVKAWNASKMSVYLKNSVFVSLETIILSAGIATTVAFVLARLKFKLNRVVYYLFIAGMMIPIHSAVIPLYIMAMDWKMQNNLMFLGIIYTAFRIPISVFILESFMSTIPGELEESAVIDGCGVWRLFLKVILPLSKDGIITITILSALASWNELLVSMLMLSKNTIKTLPIGLTSFIAEFTAEYTQLAAGILIACIPNLVFYALMQEKIVKGMTVGAVKG